MTDHSRAHFSRRVLALGGAAHVDPSGSDLRAKEDAEVVAAATQTPESASTTAAAGGAQEPEDEDGSTRAV